MALRKFLILRRSRSGRLERCTGPIQPMVNFLTASSAGVTIIWKYDIEGEQGPRAKFAGIIPNAWAWPVQLGWLQPLRPANLGSSRLCSPSPKRLHDITVRKIIMPGQMTSSGALAISAWALVSMLPQLAIGG